MKKLTIITSALLLLAGNAYASTEASATLGATSSDVTFAGTGTGCCGFGGNLAPNVNLTSLGSAALALTGNAVVISPPVSGTDFMPPESGLNYGNSFLAVFAQPSSGGVYTNPVPGTATFNLAQGQNTFGFTWGSVDTGNTLTITATNATYTITGTQLANALLGGTTSGDVDLSLTDTAGQILSATFTSSNNAFEAANFEATLVPLPAALPMFGAALFGLAALARRRKV